MQNYEIKRNSKHNIIGILYFIMLSSHYHKLLVLLPNEKKPNINTIFLIIRHNSKCFV